jgi:TRAP-type C4-dicarboxylate transport system permease small subunit
MRPPRDQDGFPVPAALRALLIKIETWLAAGSLLLLVAMVSLQALARNLFDTGFSSVEQLSRYLVLYVTFFGAVLAIERRRHIHIDVLNAFLPRHWQRRLAPPLNAVAALICIMLGSAAIRFWQEEWTYAADAERWLTILELIVPAGFILLALHFIMGLFTRPKDDRS